MNDRVDLPSIFQFIEEFIILLSSDGNILFINQPALSYDLWIIDLFMRLLNSLINFAGSYEEIKIKFLPCKYDA